MTRKTILAVAVLVMMSAPWACAENVVFLSLRIDGNEIEGDSTVNTLGRENTIECLTYGQSITTARDATSGRATGRRIHSTVKVTKSIGRTSPLLVKALCNNEPCEATFRFFGVVPGGGGFHHLYTVEITSDFVSSVRQFVPSPSDAASPYPPLLEEVEFAFRDITFTHERSRATHRDTVSDRDHAGGVSVGSDRTETIRRNDSITVGTGRTDGDKKKEEGDTSPGVRLPGGRLKPR